MIGYKPDQIPFIPVSAFEGDNVKTLSKNTPWYKGMTILEALNNLKVPEKPTSLPLRIPVEDAYTISGIAWLDDNSNGIREAEETVLSNIKLMLISKETGKVIINSKTNKELIVKTNNKGEYSFENVVNGNYLIVATFDDSKYSITSYKNSNASESTNSDFTQATINIDGVATIAGITDTITINNKDITNIDLGLMNAEIFDLALTKTISKITVQYGSNVDEHVYNKNFAKIDFSKKNVNGIMIVEYKITVKNEGDTAGYASKIVDYIPEGMTFSSELNSDWYNSNGITYNTSLADTIINPGESKELTLILTEKMSDDALGTIINTAEIAESSSVYGLADIDSTPGNKNTSEDDYAVATIVAAVKTGQAVIYTSLIIAVIAIIGTGIYFIKRKALR